MPLLWPKAPRWPSDPAITAKFSQMTGTPVNTIEWLLQNNKKQRKMDECWRHFTHLVTTFPKQEKRSYAAWKVMLCDPSGWMTALCTRGGLVTASEYYKAYCQAGMQLLPSFAYPANFTPPGGKCDECKTPCTSECGISSIT